jgi:hypothetical protein
MSEVDRIRAFSPYAHRRCGCIPGCIACRESAFTEVRPFAWPGLRIPSPQPLPPKVRRPNRV